VNHLDLPTWRSLTVFVGWHWAATPNGYTCAEIREEPGDHKRARVVGRIVRYLDTITVTCAHCGQEVDLEYGSLLSPHGDLELVGPAACSAECRNAIELAACIRCIDCGEALATRVHDGEHRCTLCASRAFRAHYARERAPTIPCPAPDFADLSADDGRHSHGPRDACECHAGPSTSAA
jgi:hypothetical protein